jgi:DNA-binding MarR family transcriptional regulator
MISRVPDVTRLVDRLASAGLVSRQRGPAEDRRRVMVRITDEGRWLLAGLDEPVSRLHEEQFAALSEQELAVLSHLLAKVHTA